MLQLHEPPGVALQSVLDLIDPVFVASSVRDEDGRIIDFTFEYLNAAAVAMVAEPDHSLVGRRLIEAYPSNLETGLFDTYCRVVETAEPSQRMVRFDDREIHGWLDIRTTKYGDGWISIARDVSQLHDAEQRLIDHEALLRATVESLLDPQILLTAVRDENGTIVDFTYAEANDAACHYLQLPRATLIGSRLLQLLPAHRATGLFTMYANVVETGTPLLLDDFVYPLEIVDDDRHYDIRCVKVSESLSITWRDVTDRELAAEQLARSASTLRATLESLFDPHVLITAVRDDSGTIVDFVYTDANTAACEYNHMPKEQLLGSRLLDLFPGHAGSGLLAMYAHVIDTGEPMVLDDYVYPQEILQEERHYDVRGVKVGDALSYTWRDVTEREVAADEVARKELLYRLLAENASDVVFLIGTDGSYVWASPSTFRVLGWQPEELIGRSSVDFVSPEDQARIISAREHPVEGISTIDEFQYRMADGDYHWMSGRSQLVLNDGELVGRVVALRDVHDQVLARQALFESEARYRLLAENSSDVVATGTTDGRIEWLTSSVTGLLGWSSDDLSGKPFIDFVHPDDAARVTEAYALLLSGETRTFEARLRSSTDEFRWLSIRVRPVFDNAGAVVGFVGGLRDVGCEVEQRQRLEETEARYRLLAENATDMVCLAGPDRRLRWVSETVSQTLGWTRDELIGTRLFDLGHPDDQRATAATRDRLYSPNATQTSFLVRLRTKAGTYRWLSGTARPKVGDDGELLSVVTGLRDVDDLVVARQAAELNADLVRAVLDASGDGMIRFSRDGRVIDINETMLRLSNRTREQWIGRTFGELGYPEQVDAAYLSCIHQVFADGACHMVEVELELDLSADTGTRWYEANLAPIFGVDKQVADVIAVSRDVTDRHRAEEQLISRASHDALTGLANRNAIHDELHRALAAGHRSGHATAVLMIDLDHFKYINDSLGHTVGDELLIAAARRMESTVRGGDLVARLGGDEFVIVMRDLDDPADAVRHAKRIVECFRTPLTFNGNQLYATTSIGIAISTGTNTVEDLLREADTALYNAKEEGRDRASLFNETLREAVTTRLAIESQLRPALERNEFEVWYQPEVNLATGDVIAVEALLRWNHPSGEIYTADRFVDAAEEAGIIFDIGAWVMAESCRRAVAWESTRTGNPLIVRVNLSTRQLADSRLLSVIDDALQTSGLDPSRLCVEITETALLIQSSTSQENLKALRARGIRIAVDDFGTGYASLAYLRDLVVDVIKIDRSFVANVATDQHDRQLIAGILALAKQLGISVTVEGVEDAEQAAILLELGCVSAQGFLYSKAIPANDIPAFLHR